jgi:hypothetical protein
MGKNINNNTWITPGRILHGIIYVLADIIFILREHLHLLVPAFLAPC